MKKIIVALAAVLLPVFSYAGSSTKIVYDKHGDRQAIIRETDKAVRIYDGQGNFEGRITRNSDGSGTYFTSDGRYAGSISCYGGCDPKSGEDD